MSKLNIDFVLLDESVVMYGFRSLMSGAQMDGFKQNPVMLYMHERAEAGYNKPLTENAVLPIGRWYDIRIQDSKLLAKPHFDDNDEFAKRIELKVQDRFLNAASVWIEPIAVSDDAAMKLPGQVGPTITKWGVLEASIVDIPNCRGALAIRNDKGEKLRLFNAKSDKVLTYLKTLVPVPSEVLPYRVYELVDEAIRLGKLPYEQRAKYLKLAAADYDAAHALISRLLPVELELLNQNGELQEILKLSGYELYMENKFERLKVLSPAHFRLKFKEYYGTEYPYQDVKANPTLESQIEAQKAPNSELQELMKLSGRELYLQGKFERLKELSVEGFSLKFQEYYGKAPAMA